jgi:phosphate transport system protein
MKRQFERELESLKTSIIKMGSVVEENFKLALQAVMESNEGLAKRVIDTDDRINSLELEIDDAIIDLLALQQPVAGDLRLIIAAQKINNDLERIGDHAVNIAESALSLIDVPQLEMLPEIPQMAEITATMLKQSLDSFILIDPPLAQTVLATDNTIDDLNRTVARLVIELVKNNTRTIECGLELIRISRNLERVADLATNISEEVLFHTQARVVKHHAEEKNYSHREIPR